MALQTPLDHWRATFEDWAAKGVFPLDRVPPSPQGPPPFVPPPFWANKMHKMNKMMNKVPVLVRDLARLTNFA